MCGYILDEDSWIFIDIICRSQKMMETVFNENLKRVDMQEFNLFYVALTSLNLRYWVIGLFQLFNRYPQALMTVIFVVPTDKSLS